MQNKATEVYLGRQAVLDRGGRIVGYELLFRSGPGDEARVDDHSAATAEVIAHAFQAFGIHAVVGDAQAFINVDGPTLMSGAVEALPPERVVIELLETISIDRDIVRRCRELKAKGYRLALDDFVACSEQYEPLLATVEIVKIDILMLSDSALAPLVKRLRKWPPRLLAEKVDTPQRAGQCRRLGFNLFQGFFFSRPVTLMA